MIVKFEIFLLLIMRFLLISLKKIFFLDEENGLGILNCLEYFF